MSDYPDDSENNQVSSAGVPNDLKALKKPVD
jgi:hypothetical protein